MLRLRPDERALGVVGVFSDQGTPIRGLSWYLRRDHWGRSIGVGRRARLDLVGRLPRTYDGETAQSLVMARAAQPTDPLVIGIRPVLFVSDVVSVVELLVNVLGLHLRFCMMRLRRLGARSQRRRPTCLGLGASSAFGSRTGIS